MHGVIQNALYNAIHAPAGIYIRDQFRQGPGLAGTTNTLNNMEVGMRWNRIYGDVGSGRLIGPWNGSSAVLSGVEKTIPDIRNRDFGISISPLRFTSNNTNMYIDIGVSQTRGLVSSNPRNGFELSVDISGGFYRIRGYVYSSAGSTSGTQPTQPSHSIEGGDREIRIEKRGNLISVYVDDQLYHVFELRDAALNGNLYGTVFWSTSYGTLSHGEITIYDLEAAE